MELLDSLLIELRYVILVMLVFTVVFSKIMLVFQNKLKGEIFQKCIIHKREVDSINHILSLRNKELNKKTFEALLGNILLKELGCVKYLKHPKLFSFINNLPNPENISEEEMNRIREIIREIQFS